MVEKNGVYTFVRAGDWRSAQCYVSLVDKRGVKNAEIEREQAGAFSAYQLLRNWHTCMPGMHNWECAARDVVLFVDKWWLLFCFDLMKCMTKHGQCLKGDLDLREHDLN